MNLSIKKITPDLSESYLLKPLAGAAYKNVEIENQNQIWPKNGLMSGGFVGIWYPPKHVSLYSPNLYQLSLLYTQ